MKNISNQSLLFLILGLVFAGVGAVWFFSQEPKEVEQEYYYPVPDADKGPHPLNVKGG